MNCRQFKYKKTNGNILENKIKNVENTFDPKIQNIDVNKITLEKKYCFTKMLDTFLAM